jgi:hypothetical protein
MPPPLFCQGWHNRRTPPPPKFRVEHIDDRIAMWYCGLHIKPYRRLNARPGVRAAWLIEEIK